MSKNRKIDRRTLLRGLGVACALPPLEAMAARPSRPRRLCVVYVPNGVSVPGPDHPAHREWSWFPLGAGRKFQLTRTLEPLERFRSQLTVIGGLSHPRSRDIQGHAAGDTFLTGGDVKGEYRNSISLDQIAAGQLGRDTRHACMTLSSDGGIGYKTRVSTLSFGPGGNPLPSESSPRQVFQRYCNVADAGSEQQQRARLQEGRKVVDLVRADSQELSRRLGKEDRGRLDEYLGTLSEIEARIHRAESWIGKPAKNGDAGGLQLGAVQANPVEYIRTMYDLIVLALQTDATRVATYMVAREDGMGLGDQFPKLALGLTNGHHRLSHDRSEGFFERWARYDQFQAQQLAYFLDRLARVRDEHGTLLENTLVLYGSACSTTHNARNYPLVLAGGQRMGLRHGQYRQFNEAVPLANLFVSMLKALGLRAPGFADSTGRLDQIFSA
jgi:Protein of unknown function (DUF1552)